MKRKKIEFIALSIVNKRQGLNCTKGNMELRVTLVKVKVINNNYGLSWDKILA